MFFKRGKRTTDQPSLPDVAVRRGGVWRLVWPIHVRPSEVLGVAVVCALIVVASWPVIQLPFAGPDVTTRLVSCSDKPITGVAGTKSVFHAQVEFHNHTGYTRSVAMTDHAGGALATQGGTFAAVVLDPNETRLVDYEYDQDGTACASRLGRVVAAANNTVGATPSVQYNVAPPSTFQPVPQPSVSTSAAPDPNSIYFAVTNKDQQPLVKAFWDTAVAQFQAANPGVTVHLSFDDASGLSSDAMYTNTTRPDATDLILGADPATPAAGNSASMFYAAGDILTGNAAADVLPVFTYQEQGPGPSGAPVRYGIPFSSSTYALFYNKRLFARAHIAGPPATWSELAADAAKVKALGVDGYGLKAPLGGDAAVLQLWMAGNGGDFMDAAKHTWTVNSPANAATFRWLADNLIKPGFATSPGFSGDPGLQFTDGALGMTVGGPDLIKKSEAGALGTAFGVAPVPGRTRPLTSPTGSADDLLVTKTHPERKAVIVKFVAFLLSASTQKRFADAAGTLPVTRSGAAAEAGNPLLKPFLDGMAKVDWLPTRARQWTTVQENLYQGFFSFPGKDSQTVLDQVQAEIPAQP